MDKYELTVVLPGSTTSAKVKKTKETIDKLINKEGGKIVKNDDWGEIELAYKIAKNASGNFIHYQLELPKKNAVDLSEKVRLTESVIRHLFVKA